MKRTSTLSLAVTTILILAIGFSVGCSSEKSTNTTPDPVDSPDKKAKSGKSPANTKNPKEVIQAMGKSLNSIVGLLSQVQTVADAKRARSTFRVALDELKSLRDQSMQFKNISAGQRQELADEHENVLRELNPKLNQFMNNMNPEVANELKDLIGELQEFR